MTDAAGDQTGQADTDLISASISETITSQRNLVFTVKMASLQSLTANARRIFTFKTVAATPKDFYVAMINNPSSATPILVYGSGTSGFGQTGFDRLGDGLAGSGYKTDGTFTVVAPASAFGLAAGDRINTFAGVVRLSAGDCDAATCVSGAAADTAAAPAANSYTLTTVAESCPSATPPDADGDGVPDATDSCPNTPAGTTVDAMGCPLVAGDSQTCAVPGKTLLTDATGDTASGTTGTDLKSFQLSQPAQTPTGDSILDQMLVFRINTDPGATLSPLYFWFVSFEAPTGVLGVRMIGDTNGNPVFQSYIVQPDSNGNSYGTFAASTKPADARSTFSASTGAITIWVKAADLGLSGPGDQLKNFNSGAIQIIDTPAVSGSNTEDGMPTNDLKRSTVSYTLHDNTICGGPPLKPVGPPPPASGASPRFYDFQSPNGLADAAGEPTVGYNPATFNAMFVSNKEVDRIVFAEHSAARDAANASLPESCPATWINKSYPFSAASLDPILETYQPAGRTFQSQLTGANSIFAFSDDDGETWTEGQNGPPNGGADHQTVGAGPYPAGSKPASALKDYAVYYCSQSVGASFCSRSDDGGVTFGPGIPFRNTATDCDNTVGALHGHVQVDRKDGTVYVPYGNCGNKVGISVSKDAGVTWTVKKVGPSAAGGDPGLGIADDGTAYLCYTFGDKKGKAMATVSRDKGDTWSDPVDLGAILGLKHAVFTTAVAGDGDRAACGFLGTTADGNAGSVDFPGVWYAYVASTYDRGKSWHVVNVSGGDAVQGAGGICTDGTTCGSNRNLLDFTDILATEQGRVLYGYADGCRGACVSDPANKSKNGLANNGVIARQSGGRTLRAAFDGQKQFNADAPIAPAAACARADLSTRTVDKAEVAWTGGDTGGTPIANYKLYRAETIPSWTFIADTGTQTTYEDTTVLATVEKYYYKVVAENSVGAAIDSNIIELPISLTPPASSCKLPGILVGSESAPGACTGTGGGCTTQTDIQKIYVAEPPTMADKVVFTIKVGDLNPTPAPGNYWFLLTKKKSGENLYFAMDTSQGAPRYSYGTFAVATLTTFTEQGTITGSFETNGYIHLNAPKSVFGSPALVTGSSIVGIEARTRVGASQGSSRDAIVGDDYTLRGTEICIEPPVVLAELDATPIEGKGPLDVTFTLSGTPSTDKSLSTYALRFGDETAGTASYLGTFAQGQTSAIVSHRYLAEGVYQAELAVTDSAGYSSTNTARKTITVLAGGGAAVSAETTPNNTLGGALPPASIFVLALLGLVGGMRRRSGNNSPQA